MTDTKTELLFFRDNLSLPEGIITLEYPVKMSAESYQYFARWVQIVLDKTKNSIILDRPDGAGGVTPTGPALLVGGEIYRSPVDLGASGVPNSIGAGEVRAKNAIR